jgi:hypothetical protein
MLQHSKLTLGPLPSTPEDESDFAEGLRVSMLGQSIVSSEGAIPEMRWAVQDRSRERDDYDVAPRFSGAAKKRVDNFYAGVDEVLSRSKESSSHSRHILEWLRTQSFAPALGKGCLFLPSDRAWRAFYSHLERPYPPFFGKMIASSFYPDCGNTSLSGLGLGFCDAGKRTVRGETGCLTAADAGTVRVARLGALVQAGVTVENSSLEDSTDDIQVIVTDGHVGLPDKWSRHVEKAVERQRRTGLLQGDTDKRVSQDGDGCDDSREPLHFPVQYHRKKLVIQTRFVVCYATGAPKVNDALIEGQLAWLSYSYRGHQTPGQEPFARASNQSVDMQIEFELVRQANGAAARYVQDADCAKWSYFKTDHAAKYNTDHPERHLTVVVVADDASGLLGMGEFPQAVAEDDPKWVLIVSLYGFRNWAKDHGYSQLYNEGDSIVHEAGHMFGLYHTFQDGCTGDSVSDTHAESMPSYTCVSKKSACQGSSLDPVHNFMDYAEDDCMSLFTVGQKRRAWCMLRRYKPTLFTTSLRDM